MAPATLGLRMNYQNLVNEMKYHKGRVVSHQFALMQPRRKLILEKPRDLVMPQGWDKTLFEKCAKRKEREQMQATLNKTKELEQMKAKSAALDQTSSSKAGHQPALGEDESERKGDPTTREEVQEMLENPRIRSIYNALEDPEKEGIPPTCV